jgi:hypothetical protein
MDVYQATLKSGGKVCINEFNGSESQQWEIINSGNGYHIIKNKRSGLVLDIYKSGKANGLSCVQWKKTIVQINNLDFNQL